jgi:transcriptional regulator with PAS, ATPase and Fis domain
MSENPRTFRRDADVAGPLPGRDLVHLKASIQQIVDAVAAALSVDVTVADARLVRVAGTGPFSDSLGKQTPVGSAFERALSSGETLVVENPTGQGICTSCESRQDCRETFEMCTPIRLGGSSIGILAIAAFTPEQRERLRERQSSYVAFLEKMSDLISSKAAEQALYESLEARTRELEAVIDNIQQGVICVDRECRIRHIKERAGARQRRRGGLDLRGAPLESVWPGSLLARVMQEGRDCLDSEEVYKSPSGRLTRFLASVKTVKLDGQMLGGVCTFSDLESVHKYAFRAIERGTSFSFDDIIGESAALVEVKERAREAARYDSNILLIGETGTGKELFARAIHNESPRRDFPFVGLNCAAIPESLLESELFGYEAGAFTGAARNGKPGKFELANHGTLFLDEIGDMPLFLQAKLLRAIQNMEITRVGGLYPRRVDARLISATNHDLEEHVKLNRFRSDLYYRLNVVPIRLPALRERPEDIPGLVSHFTAHYAEVCNKHISGVVDDAMRLLLGYSWPGNVRELENVIEYAVNFAKGDRIEVRDIRPRLPEGPEGTRTSVARDLKSLVREYTRRLVLERLALNGDDADGKEKTAAELGISRATLYRILSQN